MRYLLVALTAMVWLSGCGGWGDFKYNSDRFNFKITFPDKWEVWDKSNDEIDFLEATIPDDVPDAKMIIRAVKVAPDISPNEIFPSFLDGSDYADRQDFRIEDRGAISCRNSEGRFIKYQYTDDRKRIRGMKVMILGRRVLLEISMEMPEDDFIMHEMDFSKMIHLVEM